MTNILPEFIEYFCIRLDQIPRVEVDEDEIYTNYLPIDNLHEEMTYRCHEDYLNFNINGVTYVTIDSNDVREYLESHGYTESKDKSNIIHIPWYQEHQLLYKLSPDDMLVRKFIAFTYSDNNSPIYLSGEIGKTDEEILKTIESLKQEVLFNDEKWKNSSIRKEQLMIRDDHFIFLATNRLKKMLEKLNYENVGVSNNLSEEALNRIINEWFEEHNMNPNYRISEGTIEKISPDASDDPFYVNESNDALSFLVPSDNICKSREELEAALHPEEVKQSVI